MDTLSHGSGFASPVFGSQATFRAILDCMARPGTIAAVPDKVDAPSPLNRGTAAFLLALADDDTPVFVNHPGSEGVAEWLGFQTGARLVDRPDAAAFAVITDLATMPPLSAYRQGTLDYPDRSATLILQVSHFAGPRCLRLSGPGIKGAATLQPTPFPDALIDALAENRRAFPLGVDLVLAADAAFAALPRTTDIQRKA